MGRDKHEQCVGRMAVGKFLLLKGDDWFLLNCLGFWDHAYGFFSHFLHVDACSVIPYEVVNTQVS